MKSLKYIFITLVVAIMCSSCGVRKIAEQVEVTRIAGLSLKGTTGLKVDLGVVNLSKYDITMSEAVITLYHKDKCAVTLTQVGDALSQSMHREEVGTLWKISGFDPRSLSTYMSLLGDQVYYEMKISFSARFSTKGISKRISQENVDLQNFMAIFAKKQNNE